MGIFSRVIRLCKADLHGMMDQLEDKDQKILLPGAGRGYEAEYLYRNGFGQLTVVDIAPYPLENLRERLPEAFPESHLVESDFFEFNGSSQSPTKKWIRPAKSFRTAFLLANAAAFLK